jgi:hypothetical protein
VHVKAMDDGAASARPEGGPQPGEPGFDAGTVSESMWAAWRLAVTRHGLGSELLGRFAPTLADVPRVLWHAPLSRYTGMELARIRGLKTHGEKRVQVVIETFGCLCRLLGDNVPTGHLSIEIRPRFTVSVENWIRHALRQRLPPSFDDVRRSFVEPLLEQVRLDAGEPIVELALSRLGIDDDEVPVRDTARRLGLTRARVYQLLADIGEIIQVRWPQGAFWVGELCSRTASASSEHGDSAKSQRLLEAAQGLFFASKRPPASARGSKRRSSVGMARLQAG